MMNDRGAPLTASPVSPKTPRRWLWLLSLLVIILTTAPYIYGWLRTPAELVFTGSHSLAPGDLPVYLSYLEQVRQGATMFKDVFTPEAHSAFIFSPLWLGVGYLSRGLAVSPLVAFHLSRIILIPIFFLVLDWWLRRFFTSWPERRLAILISTFGAGAGIFLAPVALNLISAPTDLTYWPMDLYVSEGFTFLTLYQSPHFIAATILILLVLEWFWRGIESGQPKHFVGSGLAGLALMSFHPFHLPTLAAVMLLSVAAVGWREPKLFKRSVGGLFIIAGIATPMILYQALLVIWNPVAASRAAQNINATPAWWSALLSYGWLIPLALAGAIRVANTLDRRWLFLGAWLVGQLAVFMTPSPFNRRLTQAWQLPLAVFATVGLLALLNWLRKKYHFILTRPIASLFFILLFSLSPIVVIGKDYFYWSSNQYRNFPYYLEASYDQAAAWLKEHTSQDSVILAGTSRGLFVAGLSGRAVFYGHGVETLRNDEKRQAVQAAFQNPLAEQSAEALINRWGVDYVIWGGPETDWAAISPADLPGLTVVFEAAPVKIYAVH